MKQKAKRSIMVAAACYIQHDHVVLITLNRPEALNTINRSTDAQEGPRTSAEKRQPQWQGR
jgi:enoyl-CoA hydratase/carnithine racemase